MTRETSRTIAEWAEETFGSARPEALVDRAALELAELSESLASADAEAITSEAADVAILLHRLSHMHGWDLAEAIDAKMARNRGRIWERSGDGTGRHLPEAPKATTAPIDPEMGSDGVRLGAVLFHAAQIASRIGELATAIEHDADGELTVVGVLKGAGFFTSDLARALKMPVTLAYMGVSSYGMRGSSRVKPQIWQDVDVSIEGRRILIVEDLIDTGETLARLVQDFRACGAQSVRSVVLLDLTASRERRRYQPDYVGFESSAKWVSGYGIDYGERFRNLPHIHEVLLPTTREA